MQEVVQNLPLDSFFFETDSPYLAPEPYKGSLNDSSNLPIILEKLSEYLEVDKEELGKIVYENSFRLFKINNKKYRLPIAIYRIL